MDWKPEHSVGIREIDDQHKKVIEIISRIEQSVKLQRGWREIVYDVVDLRVFAKSHFEFEEGLMRMFGYKEYTKHTGEHEHFFRKLTEIESKSVSNLVESELLKFLRDWLKNHILVEDKSYAEHILSGASILKATVPTLTSVKLTYITTPQVV
ncbi:MAG: bacteriohemerythrin [Sterolibacterium sp.]|nr:bacteriohemerythrin [Sterolibacterium sp.]